MRYFLTSERLGFRTWRAEDTALAVELWAHPDVARHIIAGPPTREEALARLDHEIATEVEHGVQYWPIFLREGSAHVGCCGLRPHREGVLELGMHIHPAFWRQGFAKEAALAVIAHAFDTLGVAALFAGHNPANAASRALLLSLGFRWTHDELYPPTGAMHPSYRLQR